MRNTVYAIGIVLMVILFFQCGKKGSDPVTPPPPPSALNLNSWTINGTSSVNTMYDVNRAIVIRLGFSSVVNRGSIASGVMLRENNGTDVSYSVTYQNADSTLIISPSQPLKFLMKYVLTIQPPLKSGTGGTLNTTTIINFVTSIDSSRKFPIISDDSLLSLVQKQTFKYFWDFGHPVSGLARERNSSGETVTSGGSGFGIMSIVTAINRGFITRAQGLTRMQTIVAFLKNTAQKFKGAFPHWMNGTTGVVIPFSALDNGADLVETSFLMQGLLTARQYFTDAGAAETNLRADINSIWNGVEWNWFRQNNQNVLYWHWSSSNNWAMNFQIRGWNESLITYILAASSSTFGIPPVVYNQGWAGAPGFINGNTYYGYTLPLGPSYGGPLFFAHYSFLGTNPNGLSDMYANYLTQNKNHSLINYNYCKANPKGYFGYSDSVWGLTASDIQGGYTASSPTNDVSVIAPTAALSSFHYTPTESMKALKFFYYVLGDKLWGEYGFKDAFSLHNVWFADSYLAIDQGPIIVMIENYRSGLLWNLFTSCPEVKSGMISLGFTAPYL